MSDVIYYSNLFVGFWCFLTVMVVLVVVTEAFKRKSRDYRKMITDMYVSAKIRKFAKEEDIDIKEELKSYAKVMKNTKINYEELDDTIEREIQGRINSKKDSVEKKSE